MLEDVVLARDSVHNIDAKGCVSIASASYCISAQFCRNAGRLTYYVASQGFRFRLHICSHASTVDEHLHTRSYIGGSVFG